MKWRTGGSAVMRLLPLAALLLLALAGCLPAPTPIEPVSQAFDLTATESPMSLAADSPLPDPTHTTNPSPPAPPTPASPYPSGQINLFPGPDHYAGDVLTLEIPVHNMVSGLHTLEVTVTIDGGEPISAKAQVTTNLIHGTSEILLPYFWDTHEQEGQHTVRVQARLPRGTVLDVARPVVILPESERPAHEATARWAKRNTECCSLHYVTGTAAERDIDRLAAFVEQSVSAVSAAFRLAPDQNKLSFFFIDTVWGNGGYANADGVVIYYVDRDFGPGIGDEILTTFRHEVTHHAQWMLETAEAASVLNEGMAVYIGGGHYFTQPIPKRAAALHRLGLHLPLVELAQSNRMQIHEASYLQAAGLVAYLVETYGWEEFLQFYTTILAEKIDNHHWDTWLAGALQANFGLTVSQLETDYLTWLENIDPGEQIDNLRLTLRLQEARREYQFQHAPFLELYALGDLTKIEQLSLLTREASSPEAVAIETLIQSAQQAVFDGDYPTAEIMLAAIEEGIETREFGHPLAADYLAVARTLDEWGYEAQEISFIDGEVRAVVTRGGTDLQSLTLLPGAGDWQLAAD